MMINFIIVCELIDLTTTTTNLTYTFERQEICIALHDMAPTSYPVIHSMTHKLLSVTPSSTV